MHRALVRNLSVAASAALCVAAAARLVCAAPAEAQGATARGGAVPDDELVLTVPEATIQSILDRASPLTGTTPEGLHYEITDPRVSIHGGHIATTMAIAISGGINLLGQTLALTVDGLLDAEIVARVDRRTRSIKGGFEIKRLSIQNLEKLSDAQEIKDFLNQNLTRFDYPLDIPTTAVPELGMLLSGEITAIEVAEGKVLLHARLIGTHDRRRAP